MTTFDNRDQGFENKYAHDEEMAFKIHARCIKITGVWAAKKLGKSGADVDSFATSLVESSVGSKDNSGLIAKLEAMFAAAKAPVSVKEIRTEWEEALKTARRELLGDNA